MAKLPNNTIWSDRKRTLFGLPWSFTKYILTDDKLLIRSGVQAVAEGANMPSTPEAIRLFSEAKVCLILYLPDRARYICRQ